MNKKNLRQQKRKSKRGLELLNISRPKMRRKRRRRGEGGGRGASPLPLLRTVNDPECQSNSPPAAASLMWKSMKFSSKLCTVDTTLYRVQWTACTMYNVSVQTAAQSTLFSGLYSLLWTV